MCQSFRQSRLTVTLIPSQESRLGTRAFRAELCCSFGMFYPSRLFQNPGACATFRCSLGNTASALSRPGRARPVPPDWVQTIIVLLFLGLLSPPSAEVKLRACCPRDVVGVAYGPWPRRLVHRILCTSYWRRVLARDSNSFRELPSAVALRSDNCLQHEA